MAAKGRIPQNFIDDLLSRLDIVEVINRRVALKKTGRNYSARCPFHEEKTPSFSVNPDKQFYYCFGCGASGNALSFVMDYERHDFPMAVETLAHSAGMEVPREELNPQQQAKQVQRKTSYDLMEQIANYYQQQLREHPGANRAVDYLRERGLSGRIAKDFDIGFAPPGWDNLLKQFGETNELKQQLIDLGMLVDKDDGKLYDRFRDRIMFPIRDNRGRVIAFGGRVLGDDKPKYLNSPETDIFHKSRELYGLYQARQRNRHIEYLLVVEGYMDVVALAQYDINTGIATLGTASNIDHLRTAFRYSNELVFCFDGDEAGRKAAKRALENALPAMEDGRQIRFMFLPEGDDPDSLVRRLGSSGFQKQLNQAQALEDYFFNSLYEQANPDTLEGKARLSKLAIPMINTLPEGVFKTLMFDALAQRTGLSQQAIAELRAQTPEPAASDAATPSTPAAKPKASSAANHAIKPPLGSNRDPVIFALAMLLFQPSSARDCDSSLLPASVHSPAAAALSDIFNLLKKNPNTNTAMILGHCYGQPEYPLITEALKIIELLGEELNDDNARASFSDALNHFNEKSQDLHFQQQVATLREQAQILDKPASSNYAELNSEQKSQLEKIKLLLERKHRQ